MRWESGLPRIQEMWVSWYLEFIKGGDKGHNHSFLASGEESPHGMSVQPQGTWRIRGSFPWHLPQWKLMPRAWTWQSLDRNNLSEGRTQ